MRALAEGPRTTRAIIASVYPNGEVQLFEARTYVHKALVSLRRRGLVTRSPGPNGYEYDLTAEGRAWLSADRAA
jgi:hypothetical protein